MAKEGIDFFPLNCQLDEKFQLIEAQYGLKGFAVVIKLMQRIYGEHGYYCEWNEDITFLFARQLGLSGGEDGNNLVTDVVRTSVRRGIFDKGLFEKYGILTSRGIQKRYLDITYKRKAVNVKREYLLLSDGEIKGNVTILDKSVVRNDRNGDISKQSKEKESKVKESNNSVEYVPGDQLNQAILDFIEHRKKIKKPMTDKGVELMIKRLRNLSVDEREQIEILNQSIANGWQGIFPLEEDVCKNKSRNKRSMSNQEYDEMLKSWAEGVNEQS